MSINNPKEWAKKNKKKFANKLITQSGVIPQSEPAGFFMAGLPGAGKTEFTTNLIADLKLNVVRIDMDEIATHIAGYAPEEAHAFKEAATDVMNAVFDRVKHRKVDFIMDGTFRSNKAISNVNLALQKKYIVKIFYLHQDPKIAWEFTKDREKIEKRWIQKDKFVDTYFEVQSNIIYLSKLSLPNVTIDIVVKDSNNKVGDWRENVNTEVIDELFKSSYTRSELQRIIQ